VFACTGVAMTRFDGSVHRLPASCRKGAALLRSWHQTAILRKLIRRDTRQAKYVLSGYPRVRRSGCHRLLPRTTTKRCWCSFDFPRPRTRQARIVSWTIPRSTSPSSYLEDQQGSSACGRLATIKRLKRVPRRTYFDYLAGLETWFCWIGESHRYEASCGPSRRSTN